MPDIAAKLVEAVDFEILRQMERVEAEPPKENAPEVKALQKQADELARKIKRGSENLLEASPEVFGELQRTLLAWKQEHQKIENTLALATTQDTKVKSAVEQIIERLQDKKTTLVTVAEIEWGNQQSRRYPATLTLDDRDDVWRQLLYKPGVTQFNGHVYEIDENGHTWEWQSIEEPIRPAIIAPSDAVRDMLHRLGCTVTLVWKPIAGATGIKGERQWMLDKGLTKVCLKEILTCPSTNIPVRPVTKSLTSSCAR